MREQVESRTIAGMRPRRLPWDVLITFAKKKPLGAVSIVVLLLIAGIAVFADLTAPYSPLKQFYKDTLAPPSSKFLLGTDQFGRDVLSRLIYGGRVSLYVGFAAVSLGISAGLVIGMVSGYFGGKTDLTLQRAMDAILALPFLVTALVIVAMLGPSINNVVIAIAFSQTPRANRVVRGAVMSIKQNQYIEAAVAMGASTQRIMVRHILPNIFAPIAIIASVDLGAVIITEATLSFLGVGIPPPQPSWGGMLSRDSRQFMEQASWLAISPGVAISLTVLSFNLLGDALRDVLDPRLRT